MVMQRWDPFGEMMQLRRQLDRVFDDTVGGWEGRRGQQTNSSPIDIYDRGEDVQVRASLPGVKPEDVKISVQNNTVTIEGESREETTNAQSSYQEHRYGRMFRSFTLPASVDAGKASANFEHGVLTLTLPRAESARVRQIPVTSSQSSGTQQAIPAQSSAKGEASKTPEAQPDSKQPVASGANGGSGDSSKK
jgi:HSP20 family protein